MQIWLVKYFLANFVFSNDNIIANQLLSMHPKMNSNSTTSSWTPTKLWEPLQILTVVLAIVKFSISAVACDWGYPYVGMDNVGSYARIILFSFLICIPFGIFRKKQIQLTTFLFADIALTCYVCIKISNMAGILAGIMMLMTTIALKLIYNRRQKLLSVPAKGKLQYCCNLIVWALIACFL